MSDELTEAARIPTGSTIGMLAGGQLGRMTSMAAAPLGYRVHVFSPKEDSPTAQVCHRETVADFDDHEALERFARSVDVITYEWENIPPEAIDFVQQFCIVRPSAHLLRTTQDRLLEKRFINDAGIGTTAFAEANTLDELREAVDEVGTPCVIKSARFGYDGKGQATIKSPEDIEDAWEDIGEQRAIVEGFVDYVCEMSVVIARSPSGQIAVYDPVLNNHVEHILDTTEAPAPVEPEACERAVDIARTVAEAFDLEGVLAVELFLTSEGDLLVNEVAPRPHNSGHWTIEACHTSQFEQFVRAVCNLPLGSPARHCDAIMQNIIGPVGERWLEAISEPEANLHLYGKAEAYPGRKMGHVTRLHPLTEPDFSLLSDR
ncbi:MAG: 5-(carboxyamino)imidazole ribonucleotide synthase [Persicimonas sp.]